MTYLKNPGNLYYQIVGYSKKRDVMTLIDPHTEEEFELYNVKELLPLAGYTVVKDDPQEA